MLSAASFNKLMSRSSRSRSRSNETPPAKKIYISNLSAECTENDLKGRFGDFGSIIDVNIKDKNGIYFAFIEFEAPREAAKAVEDACQHLPFKLFNLFRVNQKEFQGKVLKVQFAKGGVRGTFNRFGGGGRGGRDNYRSDFGGDRRNMGGFRDREGGDRGGGGNRECFNCHGVGHFARDCTKPRQPRQGGFRGGRDNRGDYGGGDRRREQYRGDRDRSDRRDKDRDYERRDRDKEDRRRRSRSGSGGDYQDRRRKDRNDDY